MKCFEISKGVMKGIAIRKTAGLGLSLSLLLAGPAAFAALDLGPAGQFAVFQMGTTTSGGSFQSSNIRITGDVGFRSTSPQNNANTVVNGNVDGPQLNPPGWTITGIYGQVPDSVLQAAAQQARDFSAQAIALGATLPMIPNISGGGSYQFTSANLAEPGTYIVTTVNLNVNNSPFTLDGSLLPAGSRVIVNVTGSYTENANNGNIQLAGGLTPSQVLINYTGTGDARIQGGADLYGTILAPNANVNMNHQNTIVFGSVIAANVQFASNPQILGQLFVPEPSTVMAGCLLLLPLGASVIRMARKRKATPGQIPT